MWEIQEPWERFESWERYDLPPEEEEGEDE